MKKLLFLAALLLLLFGAAGAETWQAAPEGRTIGECLALCRDGDTVTLAPGTYDAARESFPLTVDKAITLEGAEGAVIDAPQLTSALRIEAAGVTLRGLTIGIRHIGLYAIGDDMTVEGCHICLADPDWRTSSCGAWLGGVRRAIFRDCDFTGCGICMAGPPISEHSQGLPVLTGMFEVGEEREFFTTHTIENCRVNGRPMYYITGQPTVQAPADAGQLICVDCGAVTVQGLDCSDASIGIQLTYNDRVSVSGCRADRCGIFGIYVSKCGGGTVRDSSTEGTNHGFDVRACQGVTLLRCTALNCDQGLFFSFVDHGVMADCAAIGTGQGIFTAKGKGNLFLRCRAENCENGFNLQKDSDAMMRDCVIAGCSVCGVRLDWTPCIVTGCDLTDNWVGMMAYGDVPYVLTGNTFTANRSCGLYLRGIAYSRIGGNVFTGHLKSSVDARGTMHGSLWYENALDLPLSAQPEAVFTQLEESPAP